MITPVASSLGRKDLQDLQNLSRAPVLSYLQKQEQPRAARQKVAQLQPARFPLLAAFTPQRLWNWIRQYLRYRFYPRHPFQVYTKGSADSGIYPLQGDAGEIRIALAGDWATGTDEAYTISELMRAFKPHYTIHLGDVYYVGDPREVDENFLGKRNPDNEYDPCLWPNGSKGAFALIGNHEMYALGGSAYFDRMLPTLGLIENGRSQGQKASFFCLENEVWRIIALDTGYNSVGLPLLEYIFRPDCALPTELIGWIGELLKPGNAQRGTVLLSHHQYFSRFDKWYPKPAMQLAQFINGSVLWFWGHEHRMAIYKEFGVEGAVKAYGRCIGHAGMPVDLPPDVPPHPECPVEFVDQRHYNNDENLRIGMNGFVQMTLRDNTLRAEYVDLHGTVICSEDWMAKEGVLSRIAIQFSA